MLFLFFVYLVFGLIQRVGFRRGGFPFPSAVASGAVASLPSAVACMVLIVRWPNYVLHG